MIPQSMFPPSWSREKRTAITIAAAMFAMVLFLFLLATILSFMPEPIGPAAQQFAEGAMVTVKLTIYAGLAGIVLGVLASMGELSSFLPLRWFAKFYIWVFRGTPLLVQVMFAYSLVWNDKSVLSEMQAAFVALALNVGAYNAVAISGGIMAINKGQTEAARSLGLSRLQTFVDVIFPQAMRIALPPLVNNIVSLLKDTSLAYVIGVVELANIANQIKSSSFQPTPVFITIGVIYLVLTTIMTQISSAIERQLDVERNK